MHAQLRLAAQTCVMYTLYNECSSVLFCSVLFPWSSRYRPLILDRWHDIRLLLLNMGESFGAYGQSRASIEAREYGITDTV